MIRVGLIDDHKTVLLGLRTMLEDAPDLQLTWAGVTVPEFLDAGVDIDLILLDLRLSDGSSPERNVEALRRTGIPVLAFTSAENPYHIRRAAQAGISGVLRKSESASAIVAAIRTAATGDTAPDWTGRPRSTATRTCRRSASPNGSVTSCRCTPPARTRQRSPPPCASPPRPCRTM